MYFYVVYNICQVWLVLTILSPCNIECIYIYIFVFDISNIYIFVLDISYIYICIGYILYIHLYWIYPIYIYLYWIYHIYIYICTGYVARVARVNEAFPGRNQYLETGSLVTSNEHSKNHTYQAYFYPRNWRLSSS